MSRNTTAKSDSKKAPSSKVPSSSSSSSSAKKSEVPTLFRVMVLLFEFSISFCLLICRLSAKIKPSRMQPSSIVISKQLASVQSSASAKTSTSLSSPCPARSPQSPPCPARSSCASPSLCQVPLRRQPVEPLPRPLFLPRPPGLLRRRSMRSSPISRTSRNRNRRRLTIPRHPLAATTLLSTCNRWARLPTCRPNSFLCRQQTMCLTRGPRSSG